MRLAMKTRLYALFLPLLVTVAFLTANVAQGTRASQNISLYLPFVQTIDPIITDTWLAYKAVTPFQASSYPLTLVRPNGTNRTNPLVSSLHIGSITWSPNGRQIAFTASELEPLRWGKGMDIYRVDADGSNLVKLFDIIEDDYLTSLAWSPHNKLAISYNNDIHILNPENVAELTQITDDGFDYHNLQWSPDGSFILFASNRSGKEGIYTINADGSETTFVSNPNFPEYSAALSPDGKQIVFLRDAEGSDTELYIMNVDGGNVLQLSDDTYPRPFNISSLSWSPDGRKLAMSFIGGRGTPSIWIVDMATNYIYPIGVAGYDVTWSPMQD